MYWAKNVLGQERMYWAKNVLGRECTGTERNVLGQNVLSQECSTGPKCTGPKCKGGEQTTAESMAVPTYLEYTLDLTPRVCVKHGCYLAQTDASRYLNAGENLKQRVCLSRHWRISQTVRMLRATTPWAIVANIGCTPSEIWACLVLLVYKNITTNH